MINKSQILKKKNFQIAGQGNVITLKTNFYDFKLCKKH